MAIGWWHLVGDNWWVAVGWWQLVGGKREVGGGGGGGVRRGYNTKNKLDDEWPESIFHHVGSQSVSYLLSVQCEVPSRVT